MNIIPCSSLKTQFQAREEKKNLFNEGLEEISGDLTYWWPFSLKDRELFHDWQPTRVLLVLLKNWQNQLIEHICNVDTDVLDSHQGGILPADNFPLCASLNRRFATKTGFFTPEGKIYMITGQSSFILWQIRHLIRENKVSVPIFY